MKKKMQRKEKRPAYVPSSLAVTDEETLEHIYKEILYNLTSHIIDPEQRVLKDNIMFYGGTKYDENILEGGGEVLDELRTRTELSVPFKLVKVVCEPYKLPIYSSAFNMYQAPGDDHLLATTSGPYVHIYQLPTASEQIILKTCIMDKSENEGFCAVTWCFDHHKQHPHRVVVAGNSGIIRIFEPVSGNMVATLYGHGQSINELRTNPHCPIIIASASKDHTVRIWNIQVKHALVILGGISGHRDQILSLDWSWDSKYIATCSMDHSIRIWDMQKSDTRRILSDSLKEDNVIILNRRLPGVRDEINTDTVADNFCCAFNDDLHHEYVDCIRYYGPFCISKGCDQKINIFRFGVPQAPNDQPAHSSVPINTLLSIQPSTSVFPVATLDLPNSELWFLKFDVDPLRKWFACGNEKGLIQMWNLQKDKIEPTADCTIPVSKSPVRQICYSVDGRIMIAVCEDSTIIRLNRVFEEGK